MNTAPPLCTIRPCAAADLDAMVALWRALPGVVLRAEDEPEALGRFLDGAGGLGWVAEVEGRVVGALLAGCDGRRGYLYHLGVAPAQQGRGLGRRLVDTALAALAARGIDRSHVLVMGDNAPARAFWAKLDWRERRELALYTRAAP